MLHMVAWTTLLNTALPCTAAYLRSPLEFPIDILNVKKSSTWIPYLSSLTNSTCSLSHLHWFVFLFFFLTYPLSALLSYLIFLCITYCLLPLLPECNIHKGWGFCILLRYITQSTRTMSRGSINISLLNEWKN